MFVNAERCFVKFAECRSHYKLYRITLNFLLQNRH